MSNDNENKIKSAMEIIKSHRCGLSTTQPKSGRIAMCSRSSDLEKSVRNAIEKNKIDLIEALKIYVEIELNEVKPKYDIALRKALYATTPRNKKIYGSRYDRIVDRLSLFESLQKLLNNKN